MCLGKWPRFVASRTEVRDAFAPGAFRPRGRIQPQSLQRFHQVSEEGRMTIVDQVQDTDRIGVARPHWKP